MAEEENKTLGKIILIQEPPPKIQKEFHISRIKENPLVVLQNLEKKIAKNKRSP